MGVGVVFDILNKLFPNRRESYYNELKSLEVELNKALKEGRDTDAAMVEKRMKAIREKMVLSQE